MPPAAAAEDGDVIVIALSSPYREGKRARDNNNNDEKKKKKTAKKTKKSLNNDDDGPVANNKKKKEQDKDQKNQKKKKSNKEENNRSSQPSSSCIFPMSRVRRLVRGEAGISNTDARTTHDSVFLISKASEMFLQRFAQDAFANAVKNRKKSISYQNLSSAVCNGKRYEFLSDFVPEKVKAEDALKARALAET